MTRDQIIFQLGYSVRLEKMQSTFLTRIDRALNFAQLLLGIAVIATSWPTATGIAVSALAAFSFVYQPGAAAAAAKLQKQKYEKLFALATTSSLTDENLAKEFGDIQASDSQVIGSLMNPAHFGELIRLGHAQDFELTWREKLAAFIAGDLPRSEGSQVKKGESNQPS